MDDILSEEQYQEFIALVNEQCAVTMLGGTAVVIDQTGVDFNGSPCDNFVRIPEFLRYHSHNTVVYSSIAVTEPLLSVATLQGIG